MVAFCSSFGVLKTVALLACCSAHHCQLSKGLSFIMWCWLLLCLMEWDCPSVLIEVQLDATVWSLIYFTAKSLYMFRVTQHPSSGVLKTVTAASGTGHNIGTATYFQRGQIGTAVHSALCTLRNLTNQSASYRSTLGSNTHPKNTRAHFSAPWRHPDRWYEQMHLNTR